MAIDDKFKAECPWCEKVRTVKQVSGARGPDRMWIRVRCQKCDEEFEYHKQDHKVDQK